MTEKTARQIEGMKAQTFGVEIEGNNITRQNAAKVAAEHFGTGRYENTAYRNGYMTWSAYDQQGREWKFSRDVSIAGPDDQKCELVTPVLTIGDLEDFLSLLRKLRHAGMKSSPSRGCGVHIHVGLNGTDGRDHDAKSLRNLVNIMAAHEEQIGRAICIDEGRTGPYCKTVNPDFLKKINSQKPKTMKALADCWYKGNHAEYGRTQHYNDSRYHMLNLHPGMSWVLGSGDHSKPTVEFRLFQFRDPHDGRQAGIDCREMKAYIHLCLAMSELAKEIAYASPKPQQTENEAYAFRCWMLRLGFIGDEFAKTREVLMANMEGNSAWRRAC